MSQPDSTFKTHTAIDVSIIKTNLYLVCYNSHSLCLRVFCRAPRSSCLSVWSSAFPPWQVGETNCSSQTTSPLIITPFTPGGFPSFSLLVEWISGGFSWAWIFYRVSVTQYLSSREAHHWTSHSGTDVCVYVASGVTTKPRYNFLAVSAWCH